MDDATLDKTLECVECNLPFQFTAGEQEFFRSKGLNPPRRCQSCRLQRKKQAGQLGQMHEYKCADCGVDKELPFKTTRPVYCDKCFPSHRS